MVKRKLIKITKEIKKRTQTRSWKKKYANVHKQYLF